jgi:hypothetical protein
MPTAVTVASRMIEFHRFGDSTGFLSPAAKYIRTTGWDDLAREVSPGIDYDTLLENLNLLRYEDVGSADEQTAARDALGVEAERLLPAIAARKDVLLQLDLVTNAAELWAFPFEAIFARNRAWLEHPDRGIVVTRRVRGEFSAEAAAWPAEPLVLFAHAPVATDLARSLVDDHLNALRAALAPWSRGKDPQTVGLLMVREVFSADDLRAVPGTPSPTYVHVLAHGALVPVPKRSRHKEVWGLRLGYEDEPGTAPDVIASALTPVDGRPLVVTLAACDSANQSDSVFGVQSVVQDLHRAGVPVVVGSQLPLTQPGSVTLTKALYHNLLQGEDVRVALHAGRMALLADSRAGHDWLSVVAYVRLPPEGYAEHLLEFGLRAELGLLDAAQGRADELSERGGTLEEFADVESLVTSRLASLGVRRCRLGNRRDLLDECNGLQASAFKRLAELLFTRAMQHPGRPDDLAASRAALSSAADHYRDAYRANISSHWLGMQQLALEAVLHGRFLRVEDWFQVVRAAELARDREPENGELADYWSSGTLAEAWLLAPLAGQQGHTDAALAAVALLVERATKAPKGGFAITSARRQFRRYITWWTGAHGFFPGVGDLSRDAEQLVARLDALRRPS